MGNKFLTIPNILSFLRIAIIPFIVITYFSKDYIGCLALILLSGLTDVVDGFIARKFNQISDFGKVIDPLADKLTQVAVVIMLVIDFLDLLAVWVLLIVLFIKELGMLIVAIYMYSGGAKAISARWWGKLATVCVYSTILLMVLNKCGLAFIFNDVFISVASIIATVFLIVSLIGYFKVFFIPYKKEKLEEKNNA